MRWSAGSLRVELRWFGDDHVVDEVGKAFGDVDLLEQRETGGSGYLPRDEFSRTSVEHRIEDVLKRVR